MIYEAYPKVPVEDFLPMITYAVNGSDSLDSNAAAAYVVSTIIDIARRTKILQRTVVIDLLDGTDTYKIEPPDCVEVIALLRVCDDAGNLYEMLPRTSHLQHRHGVSLEDDVLYIPKYIRGCKLEVTIAVAPKRDACEVDEIMYERYLDAVVSGTLAELYKMANASWHNAALAQLRDAQYAQKVSGIGVDRVLGKSMGPFKLKPARIFG